MRHSAYLSAALEAPEQKPTPPQLSRLARLQDDHRQEGGGEYQPDMPPITEMEDLLNLLFDIGPVIVESAGTRALNYNDLVNAQMCLGVRLSPWECRTIKRLSAEYFNESHRAEKRDAKAPWQPEG